LRKGGTAQPIPGGGKPEPLTKETNIILGYGSKAFGYVDVGEEGKEIIQKMG